MIARFLASIAVAASVCGCACNGPCNGPCDGASAPVVERVVLVGVDGMGARWIPWERMPNLSRLRAEGHYATGRNSYPTSSGINWATAMFGTIVEIHGYRRWNSRKPDVPAFEVTESGIPPCIFHEIRKQDPSAYTVSLYDWDGIGFVHATNEVDFVKYYHDGSLEERDNAVISEGVAQLKARKPVLSFLYLHLPDCYGHKNGWGSPEFTNACVHVDENIGTLVRGLDEAGLRDSTAVVVVADHGGQGKSHGFDNLDCFEIPFLVSGPAVRNGFRLREPVLLADIAPTVADLLGYRVPETWRGRPALVRK